MSEIRSNYLRLSRLVHPDKCSHPQAANAFAIVNQVSSCGKVLIVLIQFLHCALQPCSLHLYSAVRWLLEKLLHFRICSVLGAHCGKLLCTSCQASLPES